MKIGVIGIGGIAQKAYLPTYAKMRKEATFIFATRREEVRKNNKIQLWAYSRNNYELLAEKLMRALFMWQRVFILKLPSNVWTQGLRFH